MPKVTFLPMNLVVEAAVGDSILDVALGADVPIQHACGGFCACTTCHIVVKAGSLSEIEDEEDETLGNAADVGLSSRLGCQAKILGDVTVEIVNLD